MRGIRAGLIRGAPCSGFGMETPLDPQRSYNMVFTLRPSAHLPCLATWAGLGIIFCSPGIARFVQGGVVKTFRCSTEIN